MGLCQKLWSLLTLEDTAAMMIIMLTDNASGLNDKRTRLRFEGNDGDRYGKRTGI